MPWYCDERSQGTLVSWIDTGGAAAYGILLGHCTLRRPGMPEVQHVLMLDVLGRGGRELLHPYAVQQVVEKSNDFMGLQNS